MYLALLFSALWVYTDDPAYRGAMNKSMEASYKGSEINRTVDSVTAHLQKEFPVLTSTVPMAYALGIRQQVRLSSSKYTVPGSASTAYHYDHRARTGTVSITWRLP